MKSWFKNTFCELSNEEFDALNGMIKKFQDKEQEEYELLKKLPKGNILSLSGPEMNAFHKWMLRDGYYTLKSEYGSKFAREIARELIAEDGMGYI